MRGTDEVYLDNEAGRKVTAETKKSWRCCFSETDEVPF
jgi:hypothetical protein